MKIILLWQEINCLTLFIVTRCLSFPKRSLQSSCRFRLLLLSLESQVFSLFLSLYFVCVCQIHILSDQNELLAVEKPAGLPIHPCGQYRYNCLLAHLVAFKNIRSVYPTHRLDTGTSGVVVFARSPQMARNMNTLFETQKIHKQYLAHVRDPRFLLGDTLIDHKAPIGIISHKPKLCGCGGESQKSSRTLFKVRNLFLFSFFFLKPRKAKWKKWLL